MNSKQFRIYFITSPDEKTAHKLAEELVNNNLAACVNIVPGITSIYRWNNEICKDQEQLMICKSSSIRFEEIEELLKKEHPYDVPELIAVPIVEGTESYLEFIEDSITR